MLLQPWNSLNIIYWYFIIKILIILPDSLTEYQWAGTVTVLVSVLSSVNKFRSEEMQIQGASTGFVRSVYTWPMQDRMCSAAGLCATKQKRRLYLSPPLARSFTNAKWHCLSLPEVACFSTHDWKVSCTSLTQPTGMTFALTILFSELLKLLFWIMEYKN